MDTSYTESPRLSIVKDKWERSSTAKLVSDFALKDQIVSQRDFAKGTNVPRSTLRYWLSRKDGIDADPFLVEFFENPTGLAFLHRLVTAAHICFTKEGTASIHNVSDFLERSGLSAFVASSYSTQRRVSEQIDDAIIEFGKSETKRLGEQMPAKKITLCEDETFHPETCLVSIEPVSNFILFERYAPNRETRTWNEAVHDAIENLPVEVIQVASDEGRSLISHALKGLKVHHSPDCFHVIYEIGKGTCGALTAQVRKAEKEYEKAIQQTVKVESEKETFDGLEKRPQGRRPDFEKRIEQAKQKQQGAKEDLDQARLNQETVQNAKAEIGNIYHPYDLKTGQKQEPEIVSELLSDCFEKIYGATTDLSDRCKDHVKKSERVLNSMISTLAFFFQMVNIYLENMRLSDRDKYLMQNYLIPGYYLKLAAGKERDVDRKADILEKAQELLSILEYLKDTGHERPNCTIEELKKAARDCAQLFQRSSSCVEGRNAQLALRHQGIHRLSDRHLQALTVVHNYYIRRRDGTTAAERFFEAKHRDLFEFLLDTLDYPARPRTMLKLAA